MADDMNKTTGIEIPISATDNASSKVDNVSRALDNLNKRQNFVNQLSSQWSTLYKEIGKVGERLKAFTKEYKARVKSASLNNRSARYGNLFTDEIARNKEQYSALTSQKRDLYKDIKVNERKLEVETQTYQLYERMKTLLTELTNLEIARANTSNQLKGSLLNEQEYISSQITNEKQEAQLQREITESLAQDPKYIADRIAKEKASASINKQISAEVKDQTVNYKSLAVRVSNFLGMVRRFTFVGYLIRSVSNVINDFAKAGADWTENLNLFEISFGSATEGAIENLLTFADKLGVARNEILKASADFQTLANSIGVSNEISADFSIALTKLGYDIGSLRNLDFEDVFQKLQSTIYGGQVKTARTLGINITATGLEEMLAQLGLADVKFRQLSESQKVLLRAIATFKQLGTEGANVYGDLGNTITSLANRVRVLQASIQNLKLALSSYFESTFSTLVAYGTAFIQALTTILNANVEQKLASGFNNTAQSLSNANDEAEELNNTLGLLNIDKFNVLGKGSVSGGTSSNVDQILGESLNDYISDFNKATDVSKIFDKQVTDLKNKIIQFIYPLSKINEETGLIEPNLKQVNFWLLQIKDLVTTLISFAIVKKIMNIPIALKQLSEKLKTLKIDVDAFKLSFLSLTMLISSALSILTNPNLTGGQKVISFIIALTAAVAGLVISLSLLKMNWAKALSVAGLIGGSVLSIANTMGSIGVFANGGVVEDGIFTMNKHEMFGKFSDGTSVVANNMQIVEGIKGGVYEAVKEAMGGNNGTQRQMAILNINGREFARATFNDYNYVGKTNTGFSWGGNKQ